jgi:hypothetical protein
LGVTVYLREHSTRRLRKATIKDDQPHTIFVLRFGTAWETLPEGTDYAHARIAAISRETDLHLGKVVVPKSKPRTKSVDGLDVLIDAYLKSIEEHRSHKTDGEVLGSNAATEHVAPVVNKDTAQPVIGSVKRDFDFDTAHEADCAIAKQP